MVIVTLKEAGTFSATLNYKDGDNAGAGSAVRLRYTGEGDAILLFIVRQPWGEEKEVSRAEFEKIDPATIDSMEVLKDAESTAKYGDKGKNGRPEPQAVPATVISLSMDLPGAREISPLPVCICCGMVFADTQNVIKP